MRKNKKVVLLLSGGIDSTVLLYWLIERNFTVFPLIVNYGQVTFVREVSTVKDILSNLNIESLLQINVPEISELGRGALTGEYPKDVTSYNEWYSAEFFPNRNLMLLMLASNYAYKINACNVAIGVVGESYSDTSLSFLDSVKKCIEISLMQIDIIAPFANRKKDEIIRESIRLRVPIEKTFSCNALSERHCLLCSSCHERESALNQREELLRL